ncbi:SHOCT domain-containing protein [Thermosipho atlanticus]|uniref:Putative membrane protein n=1 Tax=Thermosipho atlanticus DSM 15807 TaxID=1123380 RepID=A0A1M5QWF1_9BACT|nr:SHOCT domain-containing protein [Thermosipho atlanticus]SHH17883.1 putative membrane protein [Thermosipho atlanticus DSM 15807]
MMIFWFLLIILGIWYFTKNPDVFKKLGSSQSSEEEAKKEALKILNEKFINGEITEEEYLRKKKLIE